MISNTWAGGLMIAHTQRQKRDRREDTGSWKGRVQSGEVSDADSSLLFACSLFMKEKFYSYLLINDNHNINGIIMDSQLQAQQSLEEDFPGRKNYTEQKFNNCWWGWGEIRTLACCWWGCKTLWTLRKTAWNGGYSKQNKTRQSYDTVVSLVSIYLKDLRNSLNN